MNVVQQDDSLPHQIRLYNAGGRTQVSCNCRRTDKEPTEKQKKIGLPRSSKPTYVSFGWPRTTREAKALYNDLTKHDQSRAPFTVEHLLEEK